ncbi:Serine/arginine-rich splicing factor 6 [Coemansia sp. RSA 1821]|nr:Serine/arginine-rich splicing factor 6 [Coemansia sp. RSA 1821]
MSRLFVGRLPRDVRERDLERLFKGYGEIRDICLRQGFGFVEFRERRDAEDVIHDFDGRDFMGERLMIEPARADRRRERFRGERGERGDRDYGRRDDRRRGAMNGPQRTPFRIMVENLSSSVSWQDLKDFARRAGEVSFADAHKLHPGEGIVEFTDESGLRNALRKLDGVELRGRRVIIREEMGRGGGGGRRSYSRRSRSRSYSPARERSPNYRRSSYRSRSPPRRMSRSRSPPPRHMSRSRSRSPRSPSPADERLPPPPPDRRSRSLSPASAHSPSSHDMATEPEPAVNVDEPMANSNDNWAM